MQGILFGEGLVDLVRVRAPHAELRKAGNGTAAIALVVAFAPQLVFLDIEMPKGSGFDEGKFDLAWAMLLARQSHESIVAQARRRGELVSTAPSQVATTRLAAPRCIDRLIVKRVQRTVVVILRDVQ